MLTPPVLCTEGAEIAMDKLRFESEIISVQPRIRLTRSFDQFSHTYLGYAVRLEGELENRLSTFSVGISQAEG